MTKFNLKFYFHALTQMLKEPKKFFSNMPEAPFKVPFAFLLLSSLVFTGASLINQFYAKPLTVGAIFFTNAIGMAFITAGIGYMVMRITIGKKVSFSRFFSVYAFSSGTTLLAAWVPFFIVLTEPWKWWLIGIGMVKNFGFTWQEALMVILLSTAILILFLYSFLPFMPK